MAASARSRTAQLCADAQNVFGTIAELLGTIRRLDLNNLVNVTLRALTCAIDELIGNMSHYPDPKIELEVEDLRQKLTELKTMITRRFIPGCKSMAKFAMRKEQFERICTDLRAGKAGKLQEFLATLGKRFNNCKERADAFEEEYFALKEKIGIAVEKHGSEQTRLEKGIKHKKIARWGALTVGGAAAVVGAGGVIATVATGGAAAPAVYAVFTGLLAGTAATGTAGGINIALEFTKCDRDLMVSVTNRLNDMNKEMGTIHGQFQGILDDLNNADDDLATVIKQGQSIKGRDIESIIETLEEFRENMETLVTTCDAEKSTLTTR